MSRRRAIPILTSSALVLGLFAVIPAGPVAAQPTCDGRPATITDNGPGDGDPAVGTIVGTNGRDVIVGTNAADVIEGRGGKDIICGRGGPDIIDGGAKRDRIFGGGDDDILLGGRGRDDLFGWRGDDTILGGPHDDFINGGPGTDDCSQGKGRGRIRNCERADLKVRVIAPSSPADADSATFKVRVKNRGPNATAYTLTVDEDNSGASCSPPWEGVPQDFGKLRRGQKRTRSYVMTCEINGASPMVRVTAEVDAAARDRRTGNDFAQSPFVDLID